MKNQEKNSIHPLRDILIITGFLIKIQQKIFQSMKRYLRRVVSMSILFMLFAAISNANIGIISQFASQNDNHWIGPLSIALLFLGSGIGAMYNKYINKYPYNKVIFTGAVGWDIFCAFSVMFLFIGFENYINAIIILGSLISGFIVSLYYNGIFNYINECGKRDKKSKIYFGISMCLNQSSNLVGNTASTLLIEPLGQKLYSFVMLGSSVFLSLIFLFLKEFDKKQNVCNQVKDVNQSLISQKEKQKTIDSVYPQQKLQTKNKSIPFMLFFVFALSGVIISFIYGQFSILFYRYYEHMPKQELNKLTFSVFVVEGCGEFLGGLLLAVFAKKIKNLPLTLAINGLAFLISLIFLNYGFQYDNKNVLYGGAFIIGVADCFLFSITLVIGGKWHESGLSLFNLGQSGTVAVLSVLHIWLGLQYLSIFYSAIFVLAIVAMGIYRHQFKDIHLEHQ